MAIVNVNPLKAVSALLGQFTVLQTKLEKAVEAIRLRRALRVDSINVLQAEVAECDVVAEQAENAIRGINKLLSGK